MAIGWLHWLKQSKTDSFAFKYKHLGHNLPHKFRMAIASSCDFVRCFQDLKSLRLFLLQANCKAIIEYC